MPTYRVKLSELAGAIQRNEAARVRRVVAATYVTAIDGVRIARTRVPRAFGELEESIHAEVRENGAKTIADAPHAEAVEKGSRPHWVPLAALIRWVKLRGAQGILEPRRFKRLRGTTTKGHALNIAAAIRAHESGGAVPVDAAEQVARAIQRAIAKRGTRPHWFMRASIPEIMRALDKHVKRALPPPV